MKGRKEFKYEKYQNMPVTFLKVKTKWMGILFLKKDFHCANFLSNFNV